MTANDTLMQAATMAGPVNLCSFILIYMIDDWMDYRKEYKLWKSCVDLLGPDYIDQMMECKPKLKFR